MKQPTMLCALLAGFLLIPAAQAQKSGQSISIMYGEVTNVGQVQLQSDAAKGALLGGTIAIASSSGKRSSKKARNTALGAVVGGAAAGAAQGDRSAREYTVTSGGSTTRIISDQTEIMLGDCVRIENAGSNNANIRRVTRTYCEPAAAEVVDDLVADAREEAEECVSAKRELAAAETDEQFDRALRKVEILCNT